MAEGEKKDMALNADMVSSMSVRHILIQADNTPVNDLINDLEAIPDIEELTLTREELFDKACTRFVQEIEEKGIKEKPQLELKKRNTRAGKDKATRAVCSDIVVLFHFCCGLSDTFPKDVLAAQCVGRYVNLTREINNIEKPEEPGCNGASHIMIISQITELQKKLKSQSELINALNNRVVVLENEVKSMNKGSNDTVERTSEEKEKEAVTMPPTATGDNVDQREISFEFEFTEGGNRDMSPRSGAVSSVLHKDTEEIPTKETGDDDDQWDDVEEEQTSDKVTKQDTGSPNIPKDFSNLRNINGPWNNSKSNTGKHMKITVPTEKNNNGTSKRIVSHPGTNKQTLISGARWEKSATLYVRNISRADRSDEDVCKDVRSYGTLSGVRFMQVDVVKNRYCQDVVGCRIKVPASQADTVTSVEFWPDDVECREWRRKMGNASQEYRERY